MEYDLNFLFQSQGPLRQRHTDILPLKDDLPCGHFLHTDDIVGCGAFPGARFSHQTQSLALGQRKIDSINCTDKFILAPPHRKVFLQSFYNQYLVPSGHTHTSPPSTPDAWSRYR